MIKKPIYSKLDLIKYPILSDKSTLNLNKKKYTFLVDPKLSKKEIKLLVEFLFNVKVNKINTLNLVKKKSRVGKFIGNKPRYKKAIIQLSKDSLVDLFSLT